MACILEDEMYNTNFMMSSWRLMLVVCDSQGLHNPFRKGFLDDVECIYMPSQSKSVVLIEFGERPSFWGQKSCDV